MRGGCALICAFATIIYLNSMSGYFLLDDYPAVCSNHVVTSPNSLWDAFTHDYWGTPIESKESHKSYRPFTTLTFIADVHLQRLLPERAKHGLIQEMNLNPFFFHVSNIFYYTICCILVFYTFVQLLQNSQASTEQQAQENFKKSSPSFLIGALIGASMFAVHPVHTESVSNVAGRAEILCGLFYAAGIYFYSKMASVKTLVPRVLYATAFLLCYVLSFYSKETGITLSATLIVLEILLLINPHSSFMEIVSRTSILTLLTALFMTFRFSVLGDTSNLNHIFAVDNRISTNSDKWMKFMTWTYLPVINMKLLLWPSLLSADYSFDCIPFVRQLSDQRNILSILFYATLGLLSLCLAWNIWKPKQEKYQEKSVENEEKKFKKYNNKSKRKSEESQTKQNANPNLSQLSSPNARVALAGLGWMVISFLPATNLLLVVGFTVAERVLFVPSMGLCLFVAALASKIASSKPARPVLYIVAVGFIIAGSARTWTRNYDWRTSETLYQSAVDVCPRSHKALFSLAHALIDSKEHQVTPEVLETALKHVQLSLQIDPEESQAHITEGLIYRKLKQYEKAIESHSRALNLQPTNKKVVLELARSYDLAGEKELAQQLGALTEISKGDPSLYLLQIGLLISSPNLVSVAMEQNPDLKFLFYKSQLDSAKVKVIPEFQNLDRFQGRGIVMCAGGRYITSAYVTIRTIRELGCNLPIQVFTDASREMTPETIEAFESIPGVQVIDAGFFVNHNLNLQGFQIKAISVVYSSFQQVLLLDADNVPVQDPSFLFELDSFKKNGALFWPDFCNVRSVSPEAWQMFELEPPVEQVQFVSNFWLPKCEKHMESEFESGQLLVDKRKTWKALQIMLYMNQNHEFFYQHMYGDKQTFQLAFKYAKIPYTLVKYPVMSIGTSLSDNSMCGIVMGQRHPLNGKLLFLHNHKWHPFMTLIDPPQPSQDLPRVSKDIISTSPKPLGNDHRFLSSVIVNETNFILGNCDKSIHDKFFRSPPFVQPEPGSKYEIRSTKGTVVEYIENLGMKFLRELVSMPFYPKTLPPELAKHFVRK